MKMKLYFMGSYMNTINIFYSFLFIHFTIDFVCPTVWHTVLFVSVVRDEFHALRFFRSPEQESHLRP